MRRTLASPILAISSNNPSAIFADALSASIRTARRGERSSEGMAFPHEMEQHQKARASGRLILVGLEPPEPLQHERRQQRDQRDAKQRSRDRALYQRRGIAETDRERA